MSYDTVRRCKKKFDSGLESIVNACKSGRSKSYLISSPASSVRPSLAFYFFDISSRIISWIELKLSGRHCGNICHEYSCLFSIVINLIFIFSL